VKIKKYFVTGIGTGVGKTVVSAILTEALKADYWKPVQCGGLENTDSDIVRSLISNTQTKIHPEIYKFKTPASPHYAAEIDNIKIEIVNFKIPETKNHLIIEGAGGLMVPLNENFLVIDLIKQFNADVILVSQNYLGSINHTLLSLEILKSRNIKIKGIVFNGEPNAPSEKYILDHSKVKHLFSLLLQKKIDKAFIKVASGKINNSITQ
jgi:dethiobiotin synthetase